MHSVVVWGDVRTHVLTCPASVVQARGDDSLGHSSACIFGGAYFMAQTISSAIQSLPQTTIKPRIFSYSRPSTGESHGENYHWELSRLQSDANSPLRLKNPSIAPWSRFPRVSDELRSALRENGKFEDWADSEFPECPDIVVLDDLCSELRRTSIEDVQGSVVEGKDDKADFKNALSLLVKRLKIPAEKMKAKGYPAVEPVILCSVVKCMPNLSDAGTTIWHELIKDPWLRDRTAILVDAADLRDHHHLAVSTGLSWERTAQDTILAVRRSKELKPLMQFGQVIIRYGVTGALHVVRQQGDWSYTLYFDPANDDTTWTNPIIDGTVLGHTSIYMATFVHSLTQACNSRGQKALLPDLPMAIAKAIPSAIRRCQFLVRNSYGTSKKSLEELNAHQWIPQDIFGGEFPPGNFERLAIAHVDVPPLQLRNWSIMSQSFQVQRGEIARNVVRFGPNVILNQPSLTDSRNRTAFAEDLCNAIMKLVDDNDFAFSAGPLRKSDVRDWLNQVRTTARDSHWIFGTRPRSRREKLIRRIDEDAWQPVCDTILDASQTVSRQFTEMTIKETRSADSKSLLVSACAALRFSLLQCLPAVIAESEDEVDTESIAAPFVRYGKESSGGIDRQTLIVDRREIEGFRAVQKLIKSHLDLAANDQARRPLSLAVFGPPGSGKSTTVRSIVESSRSPGMDTEDFTFNLAQWSSATDLERAFHEVTQAIANRKIPVVFFDEFDVRFDQNEFGWLKFFLAPMEDGEYRGERVKDAILVFAGGTSATFTEFSHENRSTTDEQWLNFSRAKGPDFVSRLRGYVNIVGINPADPDDELYLLRRAILIRAILSEKQKLTDEDASLVDDDILRAILHVPVYRHGGRSVRMLLDLCSSDAGRISKSSVPPIHQLNMLVDGKAFLDLVSNTSADR